MTASDSPQGTAEQGISLMLGHPDPTLLLTPELRSVMQEVFSSPQAYQGLHYGPEQGTQSLLTFLAERISREQGISVELANLMLVAGSTHAVDMLTRLFAGPGGVVLVEAPSYADALHIFRDHRAELHSVPMDDDGLRPDALEERLLRLQTHGTPASMLYTVPNFHNPTGRTLSTERRLQIIELARRYSFLIVEDDVYHDLFFEGTVPPSFYALAQGEGVASIGSFSKTLAPGLRLGWLLASREIVRRCIDCGTSQMGGGANPFAAQVVAEYCRRGHWEPHLARLRSVYRMRRDTALSALSRHMPPDATWTQPAGGFFLWLTLPEQILALHVKRLAKRQGVEIASGTGFFVNPSDGQHNLRLAYSYAAPDELSRGIQILARAIEQGNMGPAD
jgi:2-aminoadipate transaminase